MKGILGPILLGSMLVISTGCTMRFVDFTMISTKNIDLSKSSSFERAKSRVTGTDMVHIIILIPTGTPHVKEAIDKAIESVPGAVALLDGVVYQKIWYIPYIYGQSSFIVEGTPLIDRTMASSTLNSSFLIARVDSIGNIQDLRSVSRDEYESLRSKVFPNGR